MATTLSKARSKTVEWKQLECYRLKAAIRRLDADGKEVGEVSLNLEGEDIPAAVASALEGLQAGKETTGAAE